MQWLSDRVRIQFNGDVGGYICEFCPAWLVLQAARSVKRFESDFMSSQAFINAIKAPPGYGYMVTEVDYRSWLFITDYNYPLLGRVRSRPVWFNSEAEVDDYINTQEDVVDDTIGSEIVHPCKVRGTKWSVVPIKDLNKRLGYSS